MKYIRLCLRTDTQPKIPLSISLFFYWIYFVRIWDDFKIILHIIYEIFWKYKSLSNFMCTWSHVRIILHKSKAYEWASGNEIHLFISNIFDPSIFFWKACTAGVKSVSNKNFIDKPWSNKKKLFKSISYLTLRRIARFQLCVFGNFSKFNWWFCSNFV